MTDATAILSLAVAVIVIITAIVKLQANLFEKIAKMTKESIEAHSENAEAHPDIRRGIESQKINLHEFQKEQEKRWDNSVQQILEAIRNHEK